MDMKGLPGDGYVRVSNSMYLSKKYLKDDFSVSEGRNAINLGWILRRNRGDPVECFFDCLYEVLNANDGAHVPDNAEYVHVLLESYRKRHSKEIDDAHKTTRGGLLTPIFLSQIVEFHGIIHSGEKKGHHTASVWGLDPLTGKQTVVGEISVPPTGGYVKYLDPHMSYPVDIHSTKRKGLLALSPSSKANRRPIEGLDMLGTDGLIGLYQIGNPPIKGEKRWVLYQFSDRDPFEMLNIDLCTPVEPDIEKSPEYSVAFLVKRII